ncbi:MAG: hypothetical protein ACYDHT_01710, partial [Solirubrobacteraceae bacterium]
TVPVESSSSQCTSSGKCHHSGPVRSHRKASFVSVQTGEVDVGAKAAQLSLRARGGLRAIVIGRVLYLYLPGTAAPRGRPWVRATVGAAQAEKAFAHLFPFHGDQGGRPSLGGVGPYAGLIDLLAGASGAVKSVGPVVVLGQATSEFEATVAPSASAELGDPQASLIAERPGARETVQAYLTESGLPLRVVVTIAAGADKAAQTTDILGVNVPVHVTAPPARRTIGAARFRKLSSKTNESSSSSRTEAARPAAAK